MSEVEPGEGKPVVILVVFSEGKPWMVTMTGNGRYDTVERFVSYDVDYCKADDELYYHMIGGEGDEDFWLADGWRPEPPGNKERSENNER